MVRRKHPPPATPCSSISLAASSTVDSTSKIVTRGAVRQIRGAAVLVPANKEKQLCPAKLPAMFPVRKRALAMDPDKGEIINSKMDHGKLWAQHRANPEAHFQWTLADLDDESLLKAYQNAGKTAAVPSIPG